MTELKNQDLIIKNDLSKNSMGGTELILSRIYDMLPRELLEQVQIVPTRLMTPLDDTKVRILHIHDLPGDPSLEYLKNQGWRAFHKIVFVSNWQMQNFIGYYKIPWSRCVVINNFINSANRDDVADLDIPLGKEIRLIYTPTPHRGLDILVHVFQRLVDEFDFDITLDVYSSFNLYGWVERDKEFEPLYDACRKHPKINYHGTVPNEEVRKALVNSHIFAYPSTWAETSCLCLIEAMNAGLVCVHPNLAALYETAGNNTDMYQFSENKNEHAEIFYNQLKSAILKIKNHGNGAYSNIFGRSSKMLDAPHYVRLNHSVEYARRKWGSLIESLLNEPRPFEEKKFIYDTNTGMIS